MIEFVKATICGIGLVLASLYIIFCILLTAVAKPNDDDYVKSISRFRFKEEPKGFLLLSRWIGNILIICLLSAFLLGIFAMIGYEIYKYL